jgi:hypothetical protein
VATLANEVARTVTVQIEQDSLVSSYMHKRPSISNSTGSKLEKRIEGMDERMDERRAINGTRDGTRAIDGTRDGRKDSF